MVISFYANKLWWDTADFASLPTNLPDGYAGQDRETGDEYWFSVEFANWALSGQPGFTPTDITNLALWIDASDETSLNKDGSNFVQQWNDLSGNGNNLVQNTQADKPVWTASQQNGLPLVIFDGTTEFMDLTNFAGGALSQPNTAFVVCRIPTTTTTTNGVVWDTPTSNRNLFSIAALTQYRMFAGSNLSSGDALQTTVDQFSLFFNTTTSLMRRNQVEIIASGDAGSLTFEGLRLSAGTANDSFSNTEIGEIIIYDKLLNNTERDQVEEYLKSKWDTL